MPQARKKWEDQSEGDYDEDRTSSSVSLSKGDGDDDSVVTPTFRTVRKMSNDTLKYPNIPLPAVVLDQVTGENTADKGIKSTSKIATSKSEEMDKKFNETGFLSI